MGRKSIKDNLLGILTLVTAEINIFENNLSDQQKRASGTLEKWSAKDTITHLVFWNDHFNAQVEKARSGEKVPRADDYLDQINDGIIIEHKDQPFSEAIKELNHSILRSNKILSSFSAEELTSIDLFKYLDGRTLVDNALGTFGWHIPHHLSDFFTKNGDLQKAIEIQEKYAKVLQNFPSWKANFTYNLACFYAQNGEGEKAILNLKTALISKPELMEWSKKDTDLDPLREMIDFKALYIDL